MDERTAEPIPFATVQVDGTSLGAATDMDGYYTILNVRPGTDTVRVRGTVEGEEVEWPIAVTFPADGGSSSDR